MNDDIRLALARKNEMIEELYVENVRKAVAEEFKTADEVAILRKAIAYLFEIILILHEGELDNEEFAKYNEIIENIKSKVKTNLGII